MSLNVVITGDDRFAVAVRKQRQRAAALASALGPLIEQHFIAAVEAPKQPTGRPGDRIMREAVAVSEALTKLENAKHTNGEWRATKALIKAAEDLRKVVESRKQS